VAPIVCSCNVYEHVINNCLICSYVELTYSHTLLSRPR